MAHSQLSPHRSGRRRIMPTTTRAAVLAVVVIPALACAFMLLMYHALLKVAPTWFIGCTSIGPPDYSCSGAHWDVEWVPDPCAGPPPPPHPGDVTSSANPTLMHAFYMSLAFGVFTPLGSVSFSTVRGVLGLSPWAAKCFHGLFKCAAITFSILGFLQQYYGSGGACNKSGKDNHFASMHSFFGLIVLIAYWLLGPSALVFLSNTSVLKPGSYWRMEFRRYHMFVGTFAVMGGLASILTGILDMEGKRVDPDDADFVMLPFWWPLARAGFVCMALAFALAWALYEGRVPVTPSRKGTLGEVSPLIVPLSSASEARFSLAEVAVHCTADDCWIVVHGKVYDVTDFLPDHPGGSHLLLAYKGGVADEGFDRNHELSVLSHALRPHTLMGVLNDAPKDVEANAIPPTSLQPAQGIRLAAASSAAPHAFLDRHRQSLVLGARFELSHDVVRFRLILPPERRLLGLPVGKHLKVYAPNTRAVVGTQWNGRNDPEAHAAEIERKYTPTTSDDDIGFVDLVIKVYRGGENERFPDGGKMSQYLDSLKIGSVIAVSGPWGRCAARRQSNDHGLPFQIRSSLVATRLLWIAL